MPSICHQLTRRHNSSRGPTPKSTGLYPTAVVEWEGFVAINKMWPEWKVHFIKVYELRETSGVTAGRAGYN